MKKAKKIVLVVIGIILILGVGFFGYVQKFYYAKDVSNYLTSKENVKVTQLEDDYFFDGPSEDSVIVFYPGAKVETKAYAPLMYQLAESGYDCLLLHMPGNLAIWGMNRVEEYQKNSEYSYENWYLMGHSLGGAIAANYVAAHPKDFAGLILLAAFPTKDMHELNVPTLVMYGSNDEVLNKDKVIEGRDLVSKDDYYEVEIEGGNHADFGDYGAQKGDGKSSLATGEQLESCIAEIEKVMK